MGFIFDYLTGYPFLTGTQFLPEYNVYGDFSAIFPCVIALFVARYLLLSLYLKLGKCAARRTIHPEFVKDPVNKERWNNLASQAWKLTFHLFITTYAWFCFRNTDWWFKNYHTIIGDGKKQVFTAGMKWWSMLEIAYHIVGTVTTIFERGRQDQIPMNIHHFSVILLSVASYFSGFNQFGVMTSHVHDLSDMWLSILKIVNGLKMQNAIICLAVVNLFSWVYYRLYFFPLYLLGTFITIGWWKYNIPMAKWFSFFCSVLLCLHVYWLYLLLQSYWVLIIGLKKHGKVSDNVDMQEHKFSKAMEENDDYMTEMET